MILEQRNRFDPIGRINLAMFARIDTQFLPKVKSSFSFWKALKPPFIQSMIDPTVGVAESLPFRRIVWASQSF